MIRRKQHADERISFAQTKLAHNYMLESRKEEICQHYQDRVMAKQGSEGKIAEQIASKHYSHNM